MVSVRRARNGSGHADRISVIPGETFSLVGRSIMSSHTHSQTFVSVKCSEIFFNTFLVRFIFYLFIKIYFLFMVEGERNRVLCALFLD